MPKAGAAGGRAPAPATAALENSGGVKAQEAAEGKTAAPPQPAAPPLPEASGRAPPEPARAAVALAATLAGLHVGQEVRGTVRLLPVQPHALLTTPQGDFLISPAAGLEADSELALVLTRADRSLTALLLTAGGKTLDPPRPAALTLIAVRGNPAHQTPAPAPAPSAAPAPGTPAPLPPAPTSAPTPVLAPALTSLLPGETVALRGSGTVAIPQTALPQTALPQTPARTAADIPPPTTTAAAPRALLHGLLLPQKHDAPAPTISGRPVPPASADPVAALFEQGALPLTLHRLHGEHGGQGRTHTLTASLLGSAAPGERTPLTHPPASSPLARLAEAGRLVTATVLPPEAEAATGAPTPARGQAAPPERPVVRLSASGTGLRLDLPAGAPAPAPGTQLVFLVTKGHEALKAQPPALPPAQPPAQSHAQSHVQPGAQPPALPGAQPNMPARAAAEPQGRGQPAPAPSTSIATPQASAPHSPPAQPPAQSPAQSPAQTAKSAAPTAKPAATPATPSATPAVSAPAATPAPAPETAAPPPQSLLWVPGMILPAGAAPAAPAPAAATPGEALLMAIMQALGRKGFSARPSTGPAAPTAQENANPPHAAQTLARLPHTAQGEARPGPAAEGTLPATLPATLAASLPAAAPEAAPLPLTLQTPQGPVPLLFLIWQPIRPEEDGKGNGAPNGSEQDICFAVDVRFETLGLLRLRGTVNPKHLQLAVETEHPLGDALERNATQDFLHAVEAGGMTGALAFRHRG